MTCFVRIASSRHIVRNALKISLVVGTLLNLVNQGENLLDGATISWLHLWLNYLVPYCVASYSAAKNEIELRKKIMNANLIRTDSNESLLNDPAYLEVLRRQMLRFATLQLSDGHLAEDAVQEALLGAMKNAQSFGGLAAFKSWVFAILKNKIADTLRHKQRTVNISSLQSDDDDEADMSELFDRKGFWLADERPVGWGNPEATLREGQFWKVFEACLEHLPPKQARVFMMREFIELDADEICKTVELTTTNLHVLLHRARLRLRECIENNWYLQGEKHAELP